MMKPTLKLLAALLPASSVVITAHELTFMN